jgi:hypothetical protein
MSQRVVETFGSGHPRVGFRTGSPRLPKHSDRSRYPATTPARGLYNRRWQSIAGKNGSNLSSGRKIFGRLSIVAGNSVQLLGLAAAYYALAAARSAHSATAAVVAMVVGWVLLYFSCHAIAHWLVGRILGIRFAFYTLGGTGNPEGWPAGLRWLFEHLPFLGVQTEKASMQNASPRARAIMWSAGVTSSAVVPTLGVLWARHSGVPWSKLFFLCSLGWAVGTLASNWTSRTGDYSKARRALANP